MSNQLIKCPKCGNEIDIENLIQAGTKEVLEKEINSVRIQYEKDIETVKKETEIFKQKVLKENEAAIEEALNNQKKEFKLKEEKIRNAVILEQSEAYQELEKELKEKSDKLKEMNQLKAAMLKLEREKNELAEEILLKTQLEFNQKLVEEKQRMQKNAEERFELQIKELKKQLEDQKKLTEEMKKRQEQGSMQLQGEVQELAIEEYLTQNFKYDQIKEICKGDMGADSLQIINTMQRQNCGTIYYESKRTKTFNEDWIGKFKNDIQVKGADIGVLVTAVYPKGMERMGLYEGIYICTYEEFKALSFILRENIIKISATKAQQENKHEKSALLYNYLTSTEFRFQFESIVKSFVEMQSDLEAEKRAMNRIWKKREKEISNVLSATTDMYGSIQGIAGNSVKPIEQLEMPLLEYNNNEEN